MGRCDLFLYDAIKQPSTRNWLLTGILLGLGMMTKYYTLALIAGLGFIYCARKTVRSSPHYRHISVSPHSCYLLPHILWLTQNNYITITYMLDRGAAEQSSWTNHFFYPLQFIWQQFEAFVPALVIFLLLFIGKRPLTATPPLAVARADVRFYLCGITTVFAHRVFIIPIWHQTPRRLGHAAHVVMATLFSCGVAAAPK